MKESTKQLSGLRVPRLLIAILGLLFFSSSIWAQDRSISGRVTDEAGTPLRGVNVIAKGTNNGVPTNADGTYTLRISSDVTTILFTSLGFMDQEVTIDNRTQINVVMIETAMDLEEVVVIGYGTQQQRDLTGAVSQVTAKEIGELPVNTFEQTLAGQMPGVQLRQTGNPGGGPEVLIRGMGSLSNNAPLYVIDGIPIGNVVNQNDNFLLNSIATDDIQSISVLKDATAKAIYGSRASNGVVIITTKQGREGKPTISFSTYTGTSVVQDFDKPNNLNALELAIFQKERLEDRYLFNGGWGGLEQAHFTRLQNFIAAAEQDPALAKGTDWFDEITRTGITSNYHLGVNGGSQSVLYNISSGFRDEEGVIINTGLTRYTLRGNVEANLNNNIKIGLNVAPSFVKVKGADTEPNSGGFSAYSAVNATNWVDPTASVYNAEGLLNPSTHGLLSRQDFAGNPIPNGSGLFWTANPVAKILTRTQESRTHTLNMSTFVEVGLTDAIAVKSTIALNLIDRQTYNYTPKTLPGDALTPDITGRPNSSSSIAQTRNTNTIWDSQITYNNTLGGKHDIDAILLASVERRKAESTFINASDFVDEDFVLPSAGNTNPANVNNFTGGFGLNELTRIGILGRVAYSYDDKYSATVAFRRDATSRFGADNRWGNFPAVSAAWRVSEESFFAPLKSIFSDLRVEAGWGLSGNDAGIGNFAWQGNINPSNYILGGRQVSGYQIDDLANESLSWEKTEQLDIGLDLGILDDAFLFSMDYYRTTSNGFLGRTPLPTTTGLGSIIDNVGEIQNRGVEFGLSSNLLVQTTGGFRYDFNVNFTINRNEVIELQNDEEQPIGQAGNGTSFAMLREGSPIGIFRGFKVLGFYSQEDLDDPNVAKYPEATVGSVKLVDGNGDGIIEFSQADYVDIGDPNADLLFGMRHQFGYGKWDLSIVANGAIGQQIYDQKNQQLHNLDGVFNVDREVFNNRYRPGVDSDVVIPANNNLPNGHTIEARPASDLNGVTIPTTKQNTTRYWRSPNSFHIKDADYLWIKNITLGYTFDFSNVSGTFKFVKGARLYASIQNPLIISEYKTGSPEIQRASDNIVRNVNEASYPNSRFYSIGLNVNF